MCDSAVTVRCIQLSDPTIQEAETIWLDLECSERGFVLCRRRRIMPLAILRVYRIWNVEQAGRDV